MEKRVLLAKLLDNTGCLRLLRSTKTWKGVLVLNYHRVGNPGQDLFDQELWSATADGFSQQVNYLQTYFDLISVNELDDVIMQKSGRHVMITFDDGYRDNYEWAFPILQSHSATATFFLSTGFLDNPRVPWWDEISWMVRSTKKTRLRSNQWISSASSITPLNRLKLVRQLLKRYKKLPGHETENYLNFLASELETGRISEEPGKKLWMNWDMIREMRQGGMTFGGHTVNHPILANLPIEQQDEEISGCLSRIREELQEPITSFSYPVGGKSAFNQSTVECLKAHGVRWGFSYYGGFWNFQSRDFDPHDIPRVAVELSTCGPTFRSTAALPQLFA